MNQTYLTTAELAKRIKYDSRSIRERLKDSVLIEGVHYIRPFGGRKILYDWDAIQQDMRKFSQQLMVSTDATHRACKPQSLSDEPYGRQALVSDR
ncbi:hypothetical protein [Glaciecola sp. SC05]|uniref:hypothetical protein n=1 Tax=Glaciecola sp. SC05 TaxID=1987355 RepID=UPI003526F5B9